MLLISQQTNLDIHTDSARWGFGDSIGSFEALTSSRVSTVNHRQINNSAEAIDAAGCRYSGVDRPARIRGAKV